MVAKTLEDFFGDNVTTQGGNLTFDVNEIMAFITDTYDSLNADSYTSEQIAAAFIHYWFTNNYEDTETGSRLSTDKTVPFVANSATVRRSLTTRSGETQVKHDFSFSVYTKDDSSFSPNELVGQSETPNQAPPQG